MSPKEIPYRSITGFEREPNNEAYEWEALLGVRFTNKPAQIVLTPRNVAMLIRSESFIPGAISELMRRHQGGYSYYDSERHACFMQPGSTRLTLFHENAHGYTASTNPRFAQTDENIMDTDGQRNIEESMVMFAVDEGFAEWSAIEVLKKSSNEEDKEKGVLKESYWLSMNDREEAYNIFKRDVITLWGILHERQPMKFIHLTFAEMEMYNQSIVYNVGYLFIHYAMEELKKSGMKLSEAIPFLVKNPPKTIQELRNPEEYARKLLRTN